jgi:hypothetical protein
VFTVTLLLALAGGWRLLPVLAPGAKALPYRVRVKVQLPAAAGLPQESDAIRAELARPAAIEDALAAAGIESNKNSAGPATSVGDQLEVETRAANSGFELLVGLPQVAKIDAPTAAVVINRLVEAWIAGHERTQIETAERAHAAAQVQLDQARRQMAVTASEYESLVNQMLAASGPSLGSNSGQNVAEQAAAKMKANLERRVAELKTQRTVLLETRTSEHPDVVAANEELSLLESRLQQMQSDSPATESGATVSASLRDQLKSVRRRLEASRTACDRLAAQERAAYDLMVTVRDEMSFVWFPATGVIAKGDSAIHVWYAVIVLSAVLLALLAALLVPQPPLALRSVADVERAIGAPVMGVISLRSARSAA